MEQVQAHRNDSIDEYLVLNEQERCCWEGIKTQTESLEVFCRRYREIEGILSEDERLALGNLNGIPARLEQDLKGFEAMVVLKLQIIFALTMLEKGLREEVELLRGREGGNAMQQIDSKE